MKGATKGHIAILIANIVFGLNINIVKSALASGQINAFALSYFRILGSCVVFWIVSAFIPSPKLEKKDYLFLFFASLFGVVINQFTYIVGLKTTASIDASIIVTITPILTMIIAAIHLREPITSKKVIGVVLGCSGAITIILNHSGVASFGHGEILGNSLCLLSSLSYAFYLVFFKNFVAKFNPVVLMKWMFLFGSLVLLPFCWRNVGQIDFVHIKPLVLLQVAYTVFMATSFTYFLIPIGQKNLRPTTMSMYNYVQPLVASVVAIIIGQDAFTWANALGAVLVFVGVYIVTQSVSRKQMEGEKLKRT